MAALLHCGPRAFLDGTSAGAVHGLRSMPRSLIQVTLSGRITRAMPPWIRTSRVATVVDGDIVDRQPFRVAHPRRMLLRLAGQFNRHRFERAAEDAWHRGLVSPHEMASYVGLVRRPGLRGVALLDAWLADAIARPRPSQSSLELDVLQLIRSAGLPEPERQYPAHAPQRRDHPPRHRLAGRRARRRTRSFVVARWRPSNERRPRPRPGMRRAWVAGDQVRRGHEGRPRCCRPADQEHLRRSVRPIQGLNELEDTIRATAVTNRVPKGVRVSVRTWRRRGGGVRGGARALWWRGWRPRGLPAIQGCPGPR